MIMRRRPVYQVWEEYRHICNERSRLIPLPATATEAERAARFTQIMKLDVKWNKVQNELYR